MRKELAEIHKHLRGFNLDEDDSVSKVITLWTKHALSEIDSKEPLIQEILEEAYTVLNVNDDIRQEDVITSLSKLSAHNTNKIKISKTDGLIVTDLEKDDEVIFDSTDDNGVANVLLKWLNDKIKEDRFEVEVNTSPLKPIESKDLNPLITLVEYLKMLEEHKEITIRMGKEKDHRFKLLLDINVDSKLISRFQH